MARGWTACLWALACAPAAREPLPVADPPVVEERSWYEWRLGDDVVGVEERVWGGGIEVRRRWQEVVVDGVSLRLQRASRSEGGARSLWDGHRWHREAGVEIDGAPPEVGTLLALVPFEPGASRVHATVDGGGWRIDGPGVPARLIFDGDRLLEGHMGAVSWRRVAEEPPPWRPPHLDLEVPVRPVARPRTRKVGRYRVDGEELRVMSVLEAEIPRVALAASGLDDPLGAWAREAVGPTTVAWDAVVALARAVADRLQDAPRPGAPDESELLALGRGDCSEHVALFVAAAQRLGLSTRPVAGLLLVDDLLRPHVWLEVRVGDRWVAVDPTLGTAPADAARVPLSPRIDVAMDRVASGIQVEVLELR